VAESTAATMTKGPVEGVVGDERLGTNRAFLNVQAPIEPGNSGGLAVDAKGLLVGIPTENRIEFEGSGDPRQPEVQAKVGTMRPVNLARALIAAARAGAGYESPYVQPVTHHEAVGHFTAVAPVTTAGFAADCTRTDAVALQGGDAAVSFAFDYAGFTEDAHQDVAVAVTDLSTGTVLGQASTATQFPFRWHASGTACVTVGLLRRVVPGTTYGIVVLVGPNADEVLGESGIAAHFTLDR
jgi:hypothetical protein